MAELKIDHERCIGCGNCVSACAQGAMVPGDPVPVMGDGCIYCGICVDLCPAEAIRIVRDGAEKSRKTHPEEGPSERKRGNFCPDIWVFAERNGSAPASVAYELLTCGRRLADEKGAALTAIWPGDRGMAGELIAAGADKVIYCKDERLQKHLEEVYREFLLHLILEYQPEMLLFGATPFGRSIAPRLAAALKTGLTADCTELSIDTETGLLRQTRPAFGGNLMATILCPDRRPQMATVRPGVMKAGERDYGRIVGAQDVKEWQLPESIPQKTKLLEVIEKAASESIADAEILVVAGRGIGSRKNLKLVYELAELLGAKVGCSRPLVDGGWCEYPHQVGQTGCSVAPKLLISLGVSGAIQHLAGIGQAETIIAVNTDPDAPIFGVSHYKVVSDCVEVMKEMIRLLKRE